MPHTLAGVRSVVILGSTGSIGTQAVEVIRQRPGQFAVVGLSAGGSSLDLLVQQAQELFYEGAFGHGLHVRRNNFAVNGDAWNADTFLDMGTLTNNFFQKVEFWQPAS